MRYRARYNQWDCGLVNGYERDEMRNGYPVKAGWYVNKCDWRYQLRNDDGFRRFALEALYIVVDPGGGGINVDLPDKEHCLRLLDELSALLVGGVPAGCEEYT